MAKILDSPQGYNIGDNQIGFSYALEISFGNVELLFWSTHGQF